MQNDEYSLALAKKVCIAYEKSWISLYFDNIKPKIERGIVFFYDKIKQEVSQSNRFLVAIQIPKSSRHYFLSFEDWNEQIGEQTDENRYLEITLFSNTVTGFPAENSLGTQSKVFEEPYYLYTLGLGKLTSNILFYKGDKETNVEKHCMSMLTFNDETDSFISHYSPVVNFPATSCHTLIHSLEFILCDSNNIRVEVTDDSSLFIKLNSV